MEKPFRVLITRQESRSQELMSRLAERGITSFAIPLTEMNPTLSKALTPDLKQFDLIVFTSTNAVNFFADVMGEDALREHRPRVATVGSVTAQAVKSRFGIEPVIVGSGDGTSLAATIVNLNWIDKAANILWPCAEKTTGDFPCIIKQAGFRLTRLVVYETIPRPSRIIRQELKRLRPWDAVFFAAPSQLKTFTDTLPDEKETPCIAIGETTGRALVQSGYTNVIISRTPRIVDVVDAIVRSSEGNSVHDAPTSVVKDAKLRL